MKINIYLLFWVCFVITGNCLGKNIVDSITDANNIQELVKGNTCFAFELYGKLKDDVKDNLFFSPYSISASLAIVYGGALGQTQKQMKETLHFTLPDEQLFPAFGSLQKQIIFSDKSSGCQLLMANALWVQKGHPFKKDYLDLTEPFNAGQNQLDYVKEIEKSRQTINNWINEKTKDKIRDMIPSDGITEETRLVITNAVYFIGEWKNKFDIRETKDADFYLTGKKTVHVPLMYLSESFKYYEDKTLQIVELPYKGVLSLMVILPVKKQGLKEIENIMSTKIRNDLFSKMTRNDVEVYLPKYKIKGGTVSLNKMLSLLGMTDAFINGQADFSEIDGDKDLSISNVFHKAFVEVNEEGTEAVASTAISMSLAAHPALFTFRADHPFLFMIRDNRSGSILFMGRLMNPAAEE